MNFALLDQALASGVNFLTILILARRLGVENFGIFMLAWLVLLFFKSLQGGIIISPMMSIGPKQDFHGRDEYFGSVLLYQVMFIAGGSALALAGWRAVDAMRPDWELGGLALPVLAACVGDQAQEFVRRYLFTRERASRAFAVDVASYGGRMLLLLFALGDDSAQAFWYIFLSSMLGVAVALPGFYGLKPSLAAAARAWPRHWQFARWTGGAALMEWGSGHLIVIMAGGILGPAAVGAIRATTNVFAAIQALLQALNNVVPIRAAALFARAGKAAMAQYLIRVTVAAGLACIAVLAIGVAFPTQILELLYGPAYSDYAHLVYWWVIIYAAGFLQFPLSAGLCAVEHTRPFFISLACEAAFGILCAYLLPRWLGLNGVMLGILVTRTMPVLVLGIGLRAWWSNDRAEAGTLVTTRS
jgi:O-antigen/teichoic acid export membrane protein